MSMDLIEEVTEAAPKMMVHAELKLKVGGVYRDRSGREVKIIRRTDDPNYQFAGDNQETYTPDGCSCISMPGGPSDLVGEIAQAPTPDGKQKTLYIAGPMRSLPNFGFDRFDAAAADLRQRGYKVISPAEIDREIGFDPSIGTLDDFDLAAAIRRDVSAILDCDAIVMLPGHENSKGATAERHVAAWLGIDVLVYPALQWLGDELPIDEPEVRGEAVQEDILEEALRITKGSRQNQYGPPDQDFRRTAGMWSALFGDLLKEGAAFEPFHVAQAMILLKLSRLQHSRKRDSVVDTAGYARCMDVCYEASGGYTD